MMMWNLNYLVAYHRNIMKKSCPTCSQETNIKPDNKFRPFCSERCRLIDLGDWLTENNSIPTDEQEVQETDFSSQIEH